MYYIMGLLGIIVSSYIEAALVGDVNITFGLFPRAIAFTLWYPYFLFYFYILNDNENCKIQGVNLFCLKASMKMAFFINLAIVVMICWGIAKINAHYTEISLYCSLFILFYSGLSIKLLEKYIVARLISEGIKKNVKLKDFDLSKFYTEAREVFMKKLVHE